MPSRAALMDLRDRAITMPFDGAVDRVFVDVGEYVTPGQRLLMVHDPHGCASRRTSRKPTSAIFRRDRRWR